jgi:hypothetical protein
LLKLGAEPIRAGHSGVDSGFLKMMSGLKLNPQGKGGFVPQVGIPALRERLEGLSNPDLYERFARWAITPRASGLKLRLRPPDGVSELIFENTPSLREASVARTHQRSCTRSPRHELVYEQRWLTDLTRIRILHPTRAKLSPDEPEVRLIRIEMLRYTGRTNQALAPPSRRPTDFQ